MNWLYLSIGLLCGLAVVAFGWRHVQRVRRMRAALDAQKTPTCTGGIRCEDCPGTHMCGTGCFYQSDYYKGLFRDRKSREGCLAQTTHC